MRPLRPPSAFAWLIACHLHASHGNAYEIKYGIIGNNVDVIDMIHTYDNCQSCLLKDVGITSVSLHAIRRNLAIISITVPSLYFIKRLQMYCNDD
uniref:AlNc14C60G4416 protein n=1 Tax=Albugo laibachii Nc14 TaxID=890382 RepID=F0WCN4_9STRA|nr:AlNc14C60G4416 [Albugo laibachii Nc14]|eukprot:CCA18955.1 AlNc14C60G4416 [Albugo laibachii Nc14]